MVAVIRLALVVSLAGCLREPATPPCASPRELVELDSTDEDFTPVMTADRTEIVWASNRGGSHQYSVYHAERTDPSKPFGNIAKATGPMSDLAFDPWLSANRDTLWFVTSSTGLVGGNIFAARREDTAPGRYNVNPMVAFPELGNNMSRPTLTADELTLVYAQVGDLYLTTRATTNDPFSKGHVISASTPSDDGSPAMSADGQTLVFATLSVVTGEWRVMRAQRSGDDFVNAVVVDLEDATSAQDDDMPWLHPDGKTLLFSSNRAGGTGSRDLWIDCE
jgi:Tol biopolymer transport system component